MSAVLNAPAPSRDELLRRQVEEDFRREGVRVKKATYCLDRAESRTLVRISEKVGRNDPCPCGSGRKFKRCHYGHPFSGRFR